MVLAPLLTSSLSLLVSLYTGGQVQESEYVNLAVSAVEKALQPSGQVDLRYEAALRPTTEGRHRDLHVGGSDLPPGRAELSGRVVDTGWLPVEGALVSIFTEGPAPLPVASVRTNAAAEFSVPDLVAGRYRIAVNTPGATSAPSSTLEIFPGRSRILLSATGRSTPVFSGRDELNLTPHVIVKTYRGEAPFRTDLVEFYMNSRQLTPRIAGWISGTGGEKGAAIGTPFGEGHMVSHDEWEDLREDFSEFLGVLYDVRQGRDRFDALLSSRPTCLILDSGNIALASIERRRCASLLLETATLGAWVRLEGGPRFVPSTDPIWSNSPYGAWSDQDRVTAAEHANDRMRDELRMAGMLEQAHFESVHTYFRELAEAVGVAEVDSEGVSQPDEEVKRLVQAGYFPSGKFFVAVPPDPLLDPLILFLAVEDGKLCVAGVALVGG